MTTGHSKQVNLAHELIHSESNSNGTNNPNKTLNLIDPDTWSWEDLTFEEVRTRERENLIRNEQGDKDRALSMGDK